jgi:hypothetical protein
MDPTIQVGLFTNYSPKKNKLYGSLTGPLKRLGCVVHCMTKPSPLKNNPQEAHEDIETLRHLEMSRDVETHVLDT